MGERHHVRPGGHPVGSVGVCIGVGWVIVWLVWGWGRIRPAGEVLGGICNCGRRLGRFSNRRGRFGVIAAHGGGNESQGAKCRDLARPGRSHDAGNIARMVKDEMRRIEWSRQGTWLTALRLKFEISDPVAAQTASSTTLRLNSTPNNHLRVSAISDSMPHRPILHSRVCFAAELPTMR